MSSTSGRRVVVPLTNKSGGGVIAGDVVIIDTSNDTAFTTTTSGGYTGTVGVAQESIANNATGRVCLAGAVDLVNVNASVTRGNWGKTHTVVKQATGTASRAAGTFCQFSTGGTTPSAILYPVDLAGTALTNPMTTAGDIIYGGASGVPTRLAGGTSAYVLTSNGPTSAPSWQVGGFPEYCSVFGAAVSQTNGAETAVACASENYDPTGMHDTVTNNSRITIANSGYYHVDAQLLFATNATQVRGLELRKNGTNVYDQFLNASVTPFTTKPSVSFDIQLTAADYLEVYAYQNSGGSLNANVSYFNVRRFA